MTIFTQEVEEASSEEVTFALDFSDNFNFLIQSWESRNKNS